MLQKIWASIYERSYTPTFSGKERKKKKSLTVIVYKSLQKPLTLNFCLNPSKVQDKSGVVCGWTVYNCPYETQTTIMQ